VILPNPPLLLVTDRKQAGAPLEEILEQAFAAGCRWASVREKDLPRDEQLALAQRLLPIARKHGAMLTLHGDARLSREAALDGVHLSAGADAEAARAVMGADALIGISVHSAEEAAALDPEAVDYCIAGPAYATASKSGYGPFLGVAGMAGIIAACPIPVIAIGGIEPENAAEMLTAGAAGVAAMGGIMRAADPGKEIAALVAMLAQPRPR
jgi:thiamine-phosphate pyrophosphorylase